MVKTNPLTNGSLYVFTFALVFGAVASRVTESRQPGDNELAWSFLFAMGLGVAAAIEYAAVLLQGTSEKVSEELIGGGFAIAAIGFSLLSERNRHLSARHALNGVDER